MNTEIQLVIGFVVDLILTERHIADGKVKEVTPVGGLKAAYCDVRLGIELLGNAPGNRVQLHTVQTVSYTHLDVYKRQSIASTFSSLQFCLNVHQQIDLLRLCLCNYFLSGIQK